uniref:Ferric oxidoreductase domain-containing protein n=1 Tax=Panagrellus redivivus TaxID=6233 RepID=A0A7E4V8T1_PANRE
MSKLIYSLAVDGVDFALPGNGGRECFEFIPVWQRIFESLIFIPLAVYGITSAWNYLEWPKYYNSPKHDQYSPSRSTNGVNNNGNSIQRSHKPDKLLTLTPLQEELEAWRPLIFKFYAGVFFMEFLYKIITRTSIFLFNPCHVATSLQLVLLWLGRDDPRVTQLFRFSNYVMPGAFFAIAFPILNTRLIIGEVLIYFVQHLLILVIPVYLIFLGGHYRPESYYNSGWPIFGMSTILMYHFAVLQPLSLMTDVNLNCMLCPAISDPLGNRLWRIAAFTHQIVLVPIISKSYCFYAQAFSLYYDEITSTDLTRKPSGSFEALTTTPTEEVITVFNGNETDKEK